MSGSSPSPRSAISQIPRYALISLGAFLCCVALLVLFIVKAATLTQLDLTEHVYYLVLVLMGLTAAAFLFGVLPSSAAYEGTVLGGTVKLSGAIVGAALVVAGFYFFVSTSSTFPLTVYVHGIAGPQDLPLRNSGRVMLELGPDPRTAPIGENGAAYFPAIPTSFRGRAIPAWIESETYESVDPQTTQRVNGTTLHLLDRRKTIPFRLGGTVLDAAGNPLSDVRVELPEYNMESKTNENGRFELQILADGQHVVELIAQKSGYQTTHMSPTLGDLGFTFSLKRNPQ